ncbi:hypothetical protein LOK49_LG15G00768 [Camellia lanceoleosa]|uniref:Uncharacterized protein n=1 Tax=Camellia lanceoleosa TaxID=1840588 RepID=A0ACC0F3F9_9ERIC|nr:hypothetical protein LOK49_LG15G00768 [Camellia lanceoleosa]
MAVSLRNFAACSLLVLTLFVVGVSRPVMAKDEIQQSRYCFILFFNAIYAIDCNVGRLRRNRDSLFSRALLKMCNMVYNAEALFC